MKLMNFSVVLMNLYLMKKNETISEDISFEEVRTALKGMAHNKSPGQDGLTVEFYCKFDPILSDVLYILLKKFKQKVNYLDL